MREAPLLSQTAKAHLHRHAGKLYNDKCRTGAQIVVWPAWSHLLTDGQIHNKQASRQASKQTNRVAAHCGMQSVTQQHSSSYMCRGADEKAEETWGPWWLRPTCTYRCVLV